jgi:uncharacterized protein (DUF1697 family)
MKYAAFFRNLNLGRPKSPTKAQFEAAFLEAGAASAASFLTNGTLVFETGSEARAHKVLAAACKNMHRSCGLVEPGFLRTVDYLAELVAAGPFSLIDPASVYERGITFLHPDSTELPALPLESKRGDVEILMFTDTEALSLVRLIGNTPGSPNAMLEKLLGRPATSRAWNTVVRLVDKHA